jgi:hypothetical protein
MEPSDNGGSPILSYELFYRDELTATFSAVPRYAGTALTHTLEATTDSLNVGRIHYFKLRALNDVGSSAYSDEASAALAPLPA